MTINNKIMNSDKLSLEEKITLAYILQGNHRYKYIPRERLASQILFCSPAKVTQILKSLCDKGLIRWVRKEGDKYKVIIVTQEAFNLYADIYDKSDINEICIVKDNYILALGQQEAQKWLNISNNIKGKQLQEAFNKVFKKTQ